VAGTLVPALSAIATQLEAIGGGALPGISQADLAAFAADLPGKLLDHLVVGYLEGFHPILLRFLALFGIVELIHEPGDPNDPTKPPYTRRQLRFDRLGDALAQPETLVTTLYQWGDPAFDGELLLERLHDVLFALAIPATFEPDATPPSLGIHLLRINPRTDLSPPGMEAVVEVTLGAGLTVEIPILVPGLTLGLSASGAVEAGLGIQVQPPADVTLIPPSGELSGKLAASLAAAPVPPATALTLLSVVGGSRLEAGGVSLGLTSSFTWDSDATPARARGDFGVEGHVERGRLVISLAEADGFLSTLVGGFGLEAEFDLGIGWTAGGGLYFTGSAALEIQLPVHVAIGPIELTAVTLTIGM